MMLSRPIRPSLFHSTLLLLAGAAAVGGLVSTGMDATADSHGGLSLAGLLPFFLSSRWRVPFGTAVTALVGEPSPAPVPLWTLVDPLTGLENRAAFERACESGEAAPTGALLLLNLDRFRFVNATVGTRAGDELLVQLAERLGICLNGIGDVYRLDDDDFAIRIQGTPSLGKINDICLTLKAVFAQPFPLTLGEFWINASIGVAIAEKSDLRIANTMKRAVSALKKAKDVPGTGHVIHSDALRDEALGRDTFEGQLAQALDKGEFFLEYQPIVNLKTRAIETFEALLRWRHPDEGIIGPERFIHVAEATGLIVPIGQWVIRTACRDAASWPGAVGVAVNIAGGQLRDPQFVTHVEDCLATAGLAPQRLMLELTESIFAVDPDLVSRCLTALRSLGVGLALDDFGRGFSSLHYLRSFSLANLQVDRSFAKEMVDETPDARLTDLMRMLGTTGDLATTIEGIETVAQLERARALGATSVQGFLISRPLAARDVPPMLALQENRSKG